MIDVVMRCRNEMPFTSEAIRALKEQEHFKTRILFIDCDSTDGSREEAASANLEILDFDPKQYIPGAVLNLGMQKTSTNIVAFINADAIAQNPDALAELVRPLQNRKEVAATYARQVARPDAERLTLLDYGRAFGSEHPVATRFGGFFSMAASAIRRDVWECLPFDPTLRYSEDVDWVTRLSALGWTTQYVPEAQYEHSHDYDVRGQYKRRAGEGTADADIFHLGAPKIGRDLLRPLAGSLLRDAAAMTVTPKSLATRVAQAAGYFSGRKKVERS